MRTCWTLYTSGLPLSCPVMLRKSFDETDADIPVHENPILMHILRQLGNIGMTEATGYGSFISLRKLTLKHSHEADPSNETSLHT